MIKKFALGDLVTHPEHGDGKVTHFNIYDKYPLVVEFFSSKLVESFDIDGNGLLVLTKDKDILEEIIEETPEAKFFKEMERVIKRKIKKERGNKNNSPYYPLIQRMDVLLNKAMDIKKELDYLTKHISTNFYIYKTVDNKFLPKEKAIHKRWDELYFQLNKLEEDFQEEDRRFFEEQD